MKLFAVQVKKLAGIGTPSQSCVVHGVVAKKNVANRKMRTSVENPRVLLLAGALEYQRVSNKLSSFNMLLEQVRAWQPLGLYCMELYCLSGRQFKIGDACWRCPKG